MDLDALKAWLLIAAILIGGIWYISDDEPWDDPDYHIGHAHGYDEGYAEGYRQGYDEGHEAGIDDGYARGYADGLTDAE